MGVLRSGVYLPKLATVVCCRSLCTSAGGGSISIGCSVCDRKRRCGRGGGQTFGAASTFDAVGCGGGGGGGNGSIGVSVEVGVREATMSPHTGYLLCPGVRALLPPDHC